MTIASSALLFRGGRFVGTGDVGSRTGEFATMCCPGRRCDSFQNRPYDQPILLCPEENEGMSEVSDISFVPTDEGWLYLAIILDLYSKKIVGWAMRDHMKTELVLAALMMALQRQKPKAGCIHHSDRGSQYASHAYQDALRTAGAVSSMSRKGNCWDNAPAESFFPTLKTELVHHKHYATKEDAKRDLFTYIEGYYNSRRIRSAIGYVTPVEMELDAV
jgi:putative transposase